MALRKEQVLALAALAVGLLVWRSGSGEPARDVRPTPSKLEFEGKGLPTAPLLTDRRAAIVDKPWFREPSETQPLPPRVLPFPTLQPLFVVALPLDPGLDVSRAELLRLPGTPVEGVTLQAAGEQAPAAGAEPGADPGPGQEEPAPPTNGGAAATGQETAQQKRDRWARVYDQVWLEHQQVPLLGTVTATREGKPVDKFELEALDDYSGVVITLQWFSTEKERIIQTRTFDQKTPPKVVKIELARRLENEVGREIRKVPEDAAHHDAREQLIDWLLHKAREDSAIYPEALRQAEIMVQHAAGLRGLRQKARVLHAMGALADEFALYRSIEGDPTQLAFRHEGLGNLQAQLGLHVEAEADLRRAVQSAPSDARPHASLAAFLRARGRPNEAAEASARAMRHFGAVPAEDRLRVVRTEVACSLGIGAIDRARTAMTSLGMAASNPDAAYLYGCIEYAGGDLSRALDHFRLATSGQDGATAGLGVAATQLRLEQWQDAALGFENVGKQAPLLRHAARAGLALLALRLGQYDTAIAQAEDALVADPLYVYALYLKGRAQKELGLLPQALETLDQALKLRDDFTPVLMEVAEVHARLMRENPSAEQGRHGLAALKYSDRAVALAATPLVTFFERQGLMHFLAADLRGAQQAFVAARENAPKDEDKRFAEAALAVVDYTMDRPDEAIGRLQRLIEDIPDREHPIRVWAVATRERIDDHAQKEQLEDRFAREGPEAGTIWDTDRDGSLGPRIVDEALVFDGGAFSRALGEVSATRRNAVPAGGRFLAVGVAMQLNAQHQRQNTFAGLRIRTKPGASGQADFVVELGLRDGKPHLAVVDGRDEKDHWKGDLEIEVDPAAVQQLELRVLPRGNDGRQFELQVSWNGQVVHRRELRMLQTGQRNELETTLFVRGQKGDRVDVRFDDYHLERRKDG